MRSRRLCCLLAVLVLIAPCAFASGLQGAISHLSDDDLLDLFGMVVLEMDTRGLLPEIVQQHSDPANTATRKTPIPHETQIPRQDGALLPDLSSIASMYDIASMAADIINPETETIISYDPPPAVKPTPFPTYKPGEPLKGTDTVWMSRKGSKFHTVPDCSGMENPIPVTYSDLLPSSSACKNCAWWLK